MGWYGRSVPAHRHVSVAQTAVTLTAWGPLAPCSTSNWTRWFSSRVRKPLPWISEKGTKTSFAPSSGVMKPKPCHRLNHFTVPCAITYFSHSVRCTKNIRGHNSMSSHHTQKRLGRLINRQKPTSTRGAVRRRRRDHVGDGGPRAASLRRAGLGCGLRAGSRVGRALAGPRRGRRPSRLSPCCGVTRIPLGASRPGYLCVARAEPRSRRRPAFPARAVRPDR